MGILRAHTGAIGCIGLRSILSEIVEFYSLRDCRICRYVAANDSHACPHLIYILGMTPIEQNRILQCIDEQLKSRPNGGASQQTQPGAKAKAFPAEPVGELIRVRYIYCSDLFSSNVQERELVELDSGRVDMIDLYYRIGERERLDTFEFTLEMFTHEGYPLRVNDVTVKCTLAVL